MYEAEFVICDYTIEMLFKNLKSVLQMTNLISTSENGVRIQIYASLILYVLTWIVMLKTAKVAHLPIERLSIPRGLVAVAEGLRTVSALLVKNGIPDWHSIERTLVELVRAVARRDNPKRPHRLTQINATLANAADP